MASQDEYQQQQFFKDEYPKRFTLGGKNFVTIKDGFGGYCTFIPMPFHSSDLSEKYIRGIDPYDVNSKSYSISIRELNLKTK